MTRLQESSENTSYKYVFPSPATLMEIQRLGDIAPKALPHTAMSNVQVGTITVPTNHIVLGLLSNVLKSEEHWSPNPDVFRPERHLDDNMKIIRNDALIPFSTGKRQCPGESLARAELFLFFTGLIQKFTFEPIDPLNPPGLDCVSEITSMPLPYDVRVAAI